ncbi:universal stress protein [Streptomyces sp. L2]|uniref:universal stress protein n=1 Tax=Streptomyces sp. L2 TaxID=2162665 RepID=UPI0010132EFB|nr:universal stress protein [Streptomyces sp. L2]
MGAADAPALDEPAKLPVVVGVDGSEPSLRAAEWAADEAALHGAPLRLVHASLRERHEGWSMPHDPGKPPLEAMAEDIVVTAERRALRRRPEVETITQVLPEEAASGLVRESCRALVIVLGCRGRSGVTESLLGSVSLTVAGRAHCPVIVLRGRHDTHIGPGAGGRIVLGVGAEPGHSAAARFAVGEAVSRGVPVEAVRAWRRPLHEPRAHPLMAGRQAQVYEREAVELAEQAVRDAPAGLEVRRRTVEGFARDALLAASREAGLLVVGARRRRGRPAFQLGRVAHGVLHHAACPVAVVPDVPEAV